MSSRPAPRADPFAPILECGRRQVRVGLALGLAGSLSVHGAGAAGGMRQLSHLAAFAKSTHTLVLDRMYAEYDIDLQKPKPPPEPEPEEEPEEEPELPAKEQAKPEDSPVEQKPPEAAQAGKVLTAEPDPDAPVDLTGAGFVVGGADRYAGGVTASSGTSRNAVYDRRAKPGGVKGGKGKAKSDAKPKAQRREPEKDLSRPALPQNRGDWPCAFPPEADAEQIHFARVRIVVTVGARGRAESVVVQSDPGHGFAAAARRCALRQRYEVGLDRWGKPVTRTTPPITVTFTR